MIALLAAAAFSYAAQHAPARGDLVQCLAYLAQAPEYKSWSDDDLAVDHDFFEAAEGSYCSDEAMPFWSVAHDEARAELRIPAESGPTPEQQDLAERKMHSILVDAWSEARKYRSRPVTLRPDRLVKFALAWLSSPEALRELAQLPDEPLQCVRSAFRKVR